MTFAVKEVFDAHCVKLKIDAKLLKAIKAKDLQFVTKNSDHISFFGSGLLGVYPIKWLDADRDEWFDDIMEIDDVALQSDLASLKIPDEKGLLVPVINPDHKVVSSTINLAMSYLIHRFLTEKSLSQSQREEGAVVICKLLHYKFLSSLLSNYFAYPANEAIAKATYNTLSMQFMIKQLGTWGALIHARSVDAVGHTSVHRKGLLTLPFDAQAYFLSDVQTRIRNVVKAQTKVFYLVRDANGKTITTSQIMQIEDGIVIKDISRSFTQYHRYLYDLTEEPSSFIKQELIDIICNGINSADPRAVKSTLEWICNNIRDKRKAYIDQLLSETILYAFDFLTKNKISTKDLGLVIEKLKAMLVGSRVNESKVLLLRKLGDKVVKEGSGRKSSVPTRPERTAVILYIVLRTLTMSHYR
jgi:hypothetical protein